jgi:hypothetical protein
MSPEDHRAPEERQRRHDWSAVGSHGKRFELKGRSGTKPGSLVKSQVPVRAYADWDDARSGFVETDLVAHCGGNASGTSARRSR